MKTVLLSVHDRAAQTWGTPFPAPTVEAGLRGFTNEVNRVDPNNTLNNNPEDFDLYVVGYFNMDTSDITDEGTEVPHRVARAQDVIVKSTMNVELAYNDLKASFDAFKQFHEDTVKRMSALHEQNVKAIKEQANLGRTFWGSILNRSK